MARLEGLTTDRTVLAQLAKHINIKSYANNTRAEAKTPIHETLDYWRQHNAEAITAAARAWNDLSLWKQMRWTLCARASAITKITSGGTDPTAISYAEWDDGAAAWFGGAEIWDASIGARAPRGASGPQLYAECWVLQGIAPGKQPISPCAARNTDPSASPFNYQP